MLDKIFSIKQEKYHKIITILGINFKIKCIKYMQQELDNLRERVLTQQYIINNCIDINSFPQANGILRKNQIANSVLLKILSLICIKNNIKYWLDFGTCLGAVRHKGFIPWDDDIDIGMLREDYNNFIDILKKELKPYDFNINEGAEYKNYAVTRVIYKNSGIQVDIFPYDKYYKSALSDKEKEVLNKKIENTHKIFHEKYMKEFYNNKADFPRKELDYLVKTFILNNNNPVDNGILFRSIDFDYKKAKLPKILDYSDIFPLKDILYEGMIMKAPRNCDNFLNKTYGNYNLFPNIIKQHTDITSRLENIELDKEIANLEDIAENIKRL